VDLTVNSDALLPTAFLLRVCLARITVPPRTSRGRDAEPTDVVGATSRTDTSRVFSMTAWHRTGFSGWTATGASYPYSLLLSLASLDLLSRSALVCTIRGRLWCYGSSKAWTK